MHRFMSFKRVVITVVALMIAPAALAVDPNPPSIRSDRGAWPIRRQWTPAETRHYAQWVEHIYKMKTEGSVEQRLAKVDRILTDPEMNLLLDPAFAGESANPQLSAGIIRSVNNVMDCAKFTALMPAYYSYRRALPWMASYVTSTGGDVRTSNSNIPVGALNSFTTGSAGKFFSDLMSGVNSGNYRVEPFAKNSELSDTLPVSIDAEYLLPGTMNYTDGHCLLLGRVSEYGELHFLNASINVTRDIYTYNGLNTVVGITPRNTDDSNPYKGCFQGLRVFRYPIAETDAKGRVTKVRRRTNEEMKEFGFSYEQYDRSLEMTTTQHIEFGELRPQSLHDYIRMSLKRVDQISPIKFMEQYADELADVFKFREEFVQGAWQDVLRNGPITYPEQQSDNNIFQSVGRWETWSSPSSDVDRRNKYFYFADWVDYAIRWFGMMPEAVDMTGLEKYDIRSQADFARALVEEKRRMFRERGIDYTNSRGEKVYLTLEAIEDRLYDLSFDPNHPPELRWGAPIGTAERAGAPERATPVTSGAKVPMEQAYRLQYYYRCVGQRETEMSILRGMFTEGFPIRDKFDGQIATWFGRDEPTEAIAAWLGKRGLTPARQTAERVPEPLVDVTPFGMGPDAAQEQNQAPSPATVPGNDSQPQQVSPRDAASPRGSIRVF